MIHCVPVADSDRSFWMFGIAIATIVWSMNVIATANTIAASTRRLFAAGFISQRARYASGPTRASRIRLGTASSA